MTLLCKHNNIHSFSGLTNAMDSSIRSNDNNNNNNNSNAIESSSPSLDKLLPSRLPTITLPSMLSKKDPGGIGFIDDMGGGVDGLMSCTESLGFESSDERTLDDRQMDDLEIDARSSSLSRWRKEQQNQQVVVVKKFPPPLSSFNKNGQLSFFLRSVRTDGRLELTEVRVDRPEILRASREDGRLRLSLISEDEDEEEAEDEEEEEEGENLEEEEEERAEEWKVEGGGGYRRCNEMMGHHHHQNMSPRHHRHHHNNQLHVWSQQCVPTR